MGKKGDTPGLTLTGFKGMCFAGVRAVNLKSMEREYTFSPDLLRMMLSEERQKFVSALSQGSSWRELNRIKKTINQLNELLDTTERPEYSNRNDSKGANERSAG
jgi:hypothetical protein